jgi:LEA14-like dessication related protein
MNNKLWLLAPLALLVLALAGCVQPSPPEVTFQNYALSKVTLQGIEVNFNLLVKNPNPIQLDVTNYAYKIYLNDIEFLDENRTGFSLPASDQKLVAIPVYVRYDKLFGTASAILNTIAGGAKTINYRIEGSLNSGLLGATIATPIKLSGTIPIPKEIK